MRPRRIERAAAQAVEDFVDENTGEEGLLEEAKNDAGKVNKASVKARSKLVEEGQAPADEWHVLREYMRMLDEEAQAKAVAAEADEVLRERVLGKYQTLTEDEIKTLVVDAKWLAAIRAAVQGELDRVSQTLTGRVRELGERYAKTLGELACEVQELEKRVAEHLRKRGSTT